MDKKVDDLFDAAIRAQDKAKREKMRAARWQSMDLRQQALSILLSAGNIVARVAIDAFLVPGFLYLCYLALYTFGELTIPKPGSFLPWLLVYLMWRAVAFEIVVQASKIAK